MALIDPFGRAITYLRLSVTERCNLRCHYCRKPDDFNEREDDQVLSMAELTRLARLFVELGVERIRLTGGEPLLRQGIVEMVAELTALPGLQEVNLSTNALLLERLAEPLKLAGLGRINVSLDTLRQPTFTQICGAGDPARVVAGIDAAIDVGLAPVKCNMVVMGGVNDDEIGDILNFARQRGVTLRFIETMPIGEAGAQSMSRYIPAQEILSRVSTLLGADLIPATEHRGPGPARYFHIAGSHATVGVISAVSQHFCDSCNRVRLTSEGQLALCLGDVGRVDLRAPLRSGAQDESMKQHILQALAQKPLKHPFDQGGSSGNDMVALGG
ncbi:GTP 3',8-cyclase MoaA [Magnetofaba australis]|uniref:GTP 3',8-cyclase n=1 Tax=Magnetofaba australis IT-1 TaxID=1434232 RepID=A0A1Y2K6C0_9PROT|nr:GTP 3',8-cyclase MoaA [Magnetofaba australis]OSM05214.1 putative GTP cyclohydrolase subunit MoaA [Magnetofaba australis IT-1]